MSGSGRAVLVVLLLAAGAAAAWFAWQRHEEQAGAGQAAEAPQAAYDYEAHDVVLRQMNPDGRMAFQVEAKEITQLPDNGRVIARGLTMYHDPPGTTPGGPNRWTLTADHGELPAEGGVVTLSGRVRAHGLPVEGRIPVTIATEHLLYDMTTQEISSDDLVQLNRGGSNMEGVNLRANIRTGSLELKKGHATIVP